MQCYPQPCLSRQPQPAGREAGAAPRRRREKTRGALELAQEKQAVDVPREQRDQDEDDAV